MPDDATRRTEAAGATDGSGMEGGSDLAADETDSLIAASKVNGSYAFDRQGELLGSIHDVMIDKRSGQVAYAVMSFGGALGSGDSYHPLPWSMLTYDTKQGGHVVDLDRDRLHDAPSYADADANQWAEPGYRRVIDDCCLRAMAPEWSGSGQGAR